MSHLSRNAKAYAGGAAAAVVAPFGGKLAVLVIWLIQLTGVKPPSEVQDAIQYLLVGAVTWLAVWRFRNSDDRGYDISEVGQKAVKIVAVLMLSSMLAGCQMFQPLPTLSQQLKKPATSTTPRAALTDDRVLDLLDEQYQTWGGKSLRSQVIAVGGPIILDGASMAASILALSGASSQYTAGAVSIYSFLARAFGFVDPANRAMALAGGLKRLRKAERTYWMAVAKKHNGTVPAIGISTDGARLMASILSAQDDVESALIGLVPQEDADSLQEKIEAAFKDLMDKQTADEEAKAEAKANKKKEQPPPPPAPPESAPAPAPGAAQ